MKIETTYDINQHVWRVLIERERKRETCPACGGDYREVSVTGKDGREYTARCTNCDYGSVDVGIAFRADVRRLTVGQVRVYVGDLNGNTNMGGPEEQNEDVIESFMCYETGVGSGSVYTVEKPAGPDAEAPSVLATFGDEDEAWAWATERVDTLNAMLKERDR